MAKWCIVSSFDTVLLYPRFSLSRSVHRFAFPKYVDSRVEMLKSGEEWKLENDRENDDTSYIRGKKMAGNGWKDEISDNGESTQRRERGRERGRWMKREATQ